MPADLDRVGELLVEVNWATFEIDEQAGGPDSSDREMGARYHPFFGQKFARPIRASNRNNLGIVADSQIG